ncbi:kinase-like domain-containing protein [Fennellomyces sp. T-0311]|nr:kinase-like domain-containing protein [Fennellomyces sp. T-0311]
MGVFNLFQPPIKQQPANMLQPNNNAAVQADVHDDDSNNDRFVMMDGRHKHHLSSPSPNRLGFLNEFVDGWKGWMMDKQSPADLEEERQCVDKALDRPTTNSYVTQKWGNCQDIIGKGAYGKIRVIQKDHALYAVKEFRRRSSETSQRFVQRLTSEYRIASALRHTNMIRTFDLLPLNETSPVFCQVMEYCDGGDLFSLIFESIHGLLPGEYNCFFKQLMQGVAYLHEHDISHRDLKPENILLTCQGCLKISDFGSASKQTNERHGGLVGSEPYIAPEQFEPYAYEPKWTDIWSCGVIYMAMRTGEHLWHVARSDDDDYVRYIRFRMLIDEQRQKVRKMPAQDRQLEMQRARESIKRQAKEDGCDVFQGLEMPIKRLIYRILDPNPSKRPTAQQVLANEWVASVWACHS